MNSNLPTEASEILKFPRTGYKTIRQTSILTATPARTTLTWVAMKLMPMKDQLSAHSKPSKTIKSWNSFSMQRLRRHRETKWVRASAAWCSFQESGSYSKLGRVLSELKVTYSRLWTRTRSKEQGTGGIKSFKRLIHASSSSIEAADKSSWSNLQTSTLLPNTWKIKFWSTAT